jgi:hypothetical protein
MVEQRRTFEQLTAWKNDQFLPVEGCEECEFSETACFECFLYGEAVERND